MEREEGRASQSARELGSKRAREREEERRGPGPAPFRHVPLPVATVRDSGPPGTLGELRRALGGPHTHTTGLWVPSQLCGPGWRLADLLAGPGPDRDSGPHGTLGELRRALGGPHTHTPDLRVSLRVSSQAHTAARAPTALPPRPRVPPPPQSFLAARPGPPPATDAPRPCFIEKPRPELDIDLNPCHLSPGTRI
jgi:hypothetical protein